MNFRRMMMRVGSAPVFALLALGPSGCFHWALEQNRVCEDVTLGCEDNSSGMPETSVELPVSATRPLEEPETGPETSGTGTGDVSATATGTTGEAMEPCVPAPGSVERMIFVTSVPFQGDLTLQGADCEDLSGAPRGHCLCNYLAKQSDVPAGDYVAWLSDGTQSIGSFISALTPENVHFVKNDPERTCVADSLKTLLGEELCAKIDYTENGVQLGPSVTVWTGSYADGSTMTYRGAPVTCHEWSASVADYGANGRAAALGRGWSFPHTTDEVLDWPATELDWLNTAYFMQKGCTDCHDGSEAFVLPPLYDCHEYRHLYCVQITGSESTP